MLTFATVPKAFEGHIGVIQRNAVNTWLRMNPRPQIVFFGNENGVEAFAKEHGILHVPELHRNQYGAPLLQGIMEQTEKLHPENLLCYINTDIILFPDFPAAVQRVQSWTTNPFLIIGDTRCLDITEPIDFSNPAWPSILTELATRDGVWRKIGMDYFVYTRGTFPQVPPFSLRPYFDNWFVWDARRRSISVIDVTAFALAIHQNHPYIPMPGQAPGRHKGFEAQENLELLGGKDHAYRLTESSHRMTSSGSVRPYFFGIYTIRMKWIAVYRFCRRTLVKIVHPILKRVRG